MKTTSLWFVVYFTNASLRVLGSSQFLLLSQLPQKYDTRLKWSKVTLFDSLKLWHISSNIWVLSGEQFSLPKTLSCYSHIKSWLWQFYLRMLSLTVRTGSFQPVLIGSHFVPKKFWGYTNYKKNTYFKN